MCCAKFWFRRGKGKERRKGRRRQRKEVFVVEDGEELVPVLHLLHDVVLQGVSVEGE